MIPSLRPTISVALCTYNGSAYLATQWQSLLEQQQLPDEIVICDDQSTDDTLSILEQLASQTPCRVRILKNPERLGYNKNFERVLSECTGDLIFVCDQDDYWFSEKISVMSEYMTAHPEVQIAFCDAWVTDEQLQGRKRKFWDWIRFDAHAQQRWQHGEMMEVMLDGNRVMGCATVIRRTFLSVILPIPEVIPGYIYDGWIGLIGAAHNSIHFINQRLQLYRTHEEQQVGVRPQETRELVRLRDRFVRHRAKKLAPLREKQAQLAVISRLIAERVAPNAPGMPLLHRRLAHYTMRSCLPHERLRRLGPVLRSLGQGNYNRYADAAANWYAPYLAALGDMLE